MLLTPPPPICPHYVCVNFYLCFTFLPLWHWSRTKRTKEMRRPWRLTTVVLRLADHLYPFKDTTVSGETANVDDGHRLIFLFIGSLRKALWWFISVISYRERFFPPPCALWPWDLKMNGFHLSIGRSHVGHSNGAPLWNANAKENLWFSSSQHKSRLWGSYRSKRETYEDRGRERKWERKIFCVCVLPLCEVCTRLQIVDIFLPVWQTPGNLTSKFTAIRVHYGIAIMSGTKSINVLCVSMLLQHGLTDFSYQLWSLHILPTDTKELQKSHLNVHLQIDYKTRPQ